MEILLIKKGALSQQSIQINCVKSASNTLILVNQLTKQIAIQSTAEQKQKQNPEAEDHTLVKRPAGQLFGENIVSGLLFWTPIKSKCQGGLLGFFYSLVVLQKYFAMSFGTLKIISFGDSRVKVLNICFNPIVTTFDVVDLSPCLCM